MYGAWDVRYGATTGMDVYMDVQAWAVFMRHIVDGAI